MKRNLKIFLIALLFIVLTLIPILFNIFGLKESKNDIAYKQEILDLADNKDYKMENMEIILGPDGIKKFIKHNTNNRNVYYPLDSKFHANLHIHSTASDGTMTPQQILDQAADLAEKKHTTIYVATTDHNTVNGAKEVLDIIQKNPDKYKNIKVILGMEVFSTFENKKVIKNPIDIHVLCWGINPYDEELNEVFYKANLDDKWNYSWRTFEDAIKLMSRKGLVGIAHPARYADGNLKVTDNAYYRVLFQTYKKHNSNGVYFTEGYYQSYNKKSEFKLLDVINQEIKKAKLIKTGSCDSHGNNIMHQ